MHPQVALSADFLEAFSKIPRKSQKQVRAFIEKFKANPLQASIHYEPIHAMRDDKVRTVRIGDDYRAIVVQPPQGDVYLLVWVDHHDEAMRWAKHKVFEVNPHTGSFQVWQAVEGADAAAPVAPVAAIAALEAEAVPSGRLLAGRTNDELLLFGVPEPLLPAVRALRTEQDLDRLAEHLPEEATDALYYLAAGYSVDATIDELDRQAAPLEITAPPVDTNDFAAALLRPESKRQFKVVEDDAELLDILDAPLARWRIFLHPSQDKLVRMHAKGPVRVLGGAGTGKTVVAMHRARHLAKHALAAGDRRVLFTTFTANLARDIAHNLRELCGPELERIEVVNLHKWAQRFLTSRGVKVKALREDQRRKLWSEVADRFEFDHPPSFYSDEWELVVQAQAIADEATYLKARRAGRGTPLSRAQRKDAWKVMAAYRAELERRGLLEHTDILREARLLLEQHGGAAALLPYAALVADEVQDFSPEDLRLVRAIVPEGPDDLFVVGDAHQRIYKHHASLGRCGINIRGRRSARLTVNYRTTARIRRFAEALLEGMAVDDLDDGTDTTRGYRSLRVGAAPELLHCATADEEAALIVARVQAWLQEVTPENICIAARKTEHLEERYLPLLRNAGIDAALIQPDEDAAAPGVRLATMHRVKGLEFPRVILASVHAGDMPLALPADALSDDAARRAHEDAERRLLYVAATRARDQLLVTGYGRECPLLARAAAAPRPAGPAGR